MNDEKNKSPDASTVASAAAVPSAPSVRTPAAAEKKLDPAVAAIHADRLEQAKVETRFDASLFRRKMQQ